MEVCRVCLSKQTNKEITELQIKKSDDKKSYIEIMLFCLGIMVTEDSKISKKLCIRCFKKIINFHKFKALALKSDKYLRSLSSDENESKIEVFLSDSIKVDEISSINELVLLDQIKQEPEQNDALGEDTHTYESDDELLSAIKIKYEYISEETKADEVKDITEQTKDTIEDTKENAPIKKAGRRKQLSRKTRTKVNSNIGGICEECGKLVMNIKDHAVMHLPAEQRKRLKCKVESCDRVFSTYNARCRHYKIKHLGIKAHCDICNKKVTSLKSHHLQVHDRASLPFECVLCDRRFLSRSLLEEHTTLHTKDRPYECEICNKKYRTKLAMTSHKRQVHDKEKSHLCQFCSKSFFKKFHLQQHLRIHTKEKPYECAECGKSFASNTQLRSHRLIHSEVKMFQCTHCSSSFSKPGYLRNHMISHTKEKKHACKYCGVKFGRSDHRKRHEFTAHEKRLLTTDA